MDSTTAITDCAVLRIEKKAMMEALHRKHEFSDMFVAYLLARNIRYEEDLVDQLFNSSEKRLARILLLLARFGKEGVPETVVPKISQEMLAEMIGTTRSRVSFFMNRFRKLGFIRYNGGGKSTTHFSTSFSTISFRRNPKAQLKDSEQLRHLLDLSRRAAAFSSRPPPPATWPCYERFPRCR